MSDSGVVDQDVYAPEFLTNCSKQVRDTLLIAHIASVGEDIYVVAGQLLGNAAQLSIVPATDDEIAALIRQRPRNRQSDALGCAGDECDFLLEGQEEILTAESAEKSHRIRRENRE